MKYYAVKWPSGKVHCHEEKSVPEPSLIHPWKTWAVDGKEQSRSDYEESTEAKTVTCKKCLRVMEARGIEI